MSRDAGRVVIIGGGLAGYSAADALRSLGHAGPITLIDPEPAVYDRPPLSKDLFADDFSLEKLTLASDTALHEKRIDARLGSHAVAVDPVALRVTLADGGTLEADTILLATGGRARTLSIPGGDSSRVHVLRTFEDATRVRHAVAEGARVTIIGAGLIGAELASAARLTGASVTVVDPVAVPLSPAVGELMAAYLHGMHAANGVDTVLGITSSFEDAGDHVVVVLDDERTIPSDLVVVGIGIVPNTALADDAGIDVDNGVLVDHLHRTSAPGIYAAGDVSRRRDEDGTLHRRAEHWEAAQLDGQRAARGMLGIEPPESGAEWFWSDRHGVHMEATGRLSGDGEIISRTAGTHPSVFLLHDGVLVGAAAIDDTMTIRAARRLIDQRIPVDARDLADPSIALRGLLRAAR